MKINLVKVTLRKSVTLHAQMLEFVGINHH